MYPVIQVHVMLVSKEVQHHFSALVKSHFLLAFHTCGSFSFIKILDTTLVFFISDFEQYPLLHCCLSWSLHSSYCDQQLPSTSFGDHTYMEWELSGTGLYIVVLSWPSSTAVKWFPGPEPCNSPSCDPVFEEGVISSRSLTLPEPSKSWPCGLSLHQILHVLVN